jgi:uncharacterized protein YndB with AHSA1/START domain
MSKLVSASVTDVRICSILMAMKLQADFEINKPLSEVWKYYTDLRNQKHWQIGLINTKKASKSVSTKGSAFAHVYGGKRGYIIVIEQVLESAKEKKFVTKQESDHFVTTRTTVFSGGKRKSKLVLEVETVFKSWWLRLMSPIIREEYQRRLEVDFEELEKMLTKKK